ncbi:MAG: hypothetical protein KGI03_03765 [Patescibacteria group bacterium]|nr:hypothetical protein [Patescibacteria group bacterium]
MTLILWIIAAIVDMVIADDLSFIALFPVAGFVLLIGSWVMGWSLFNAGTYAHMIGSMEAREWTRDIQPKDPRHMAMVTPDNAFYLAKKAIGQEGAIGSQFSLNQDAMTLQRHGGELVYVVPLDFKGFSTWTGTEGVPAYIIVSAEDPERRPEMVKLPRGEELKYTPDAYFSYYLTRHLREQGYVNVALEDPWFELDENNKPWWITPTYVPTVMWSGERVTGVLVTNPASGDTRWYALQDAPSWIDRLMPRDIVRNYVSWWGDLSGGWWNSFWTQKSLTQPEKTILVYGSDNRLMYVTDITSSNGKDDSLVGLVYTDTRTGKSSLYYVTGGATASAILSAVNHNQDVHYKNLHGDWAQLYNIDNTMGVVVPLLNAQDAFQGVAIAELQNPQDVAVGTTQFEALNRYKAILARRGQQVAIENIAEAKTLSGTIDRIRQDVSGPYYFIVTGTPHIFTASSQDYPKLPLAEKGDAVELKYLASGETVLPVITFDDLSITVEKTKAEGQVAGAAAARQAKEGERNLSVDTEAQFRNLTPEQREQLLKQMKK